MTWHRHEDKLGFDSTWHRTCWQETQWHMSIGSLRPVLHWTFTVYSAGCSTHWLDCHLQPFLVFSQRMQHICDTPSHATVFMPQRYVICVLVQVMCEINYWFANLASCVLLKWAAWILRCHGINTGNVEVPTAKSPNMLTSMIVILGKPQIKNTSRSCKASKEKS